jgi:hypothetical protein
MKKYLPGAQTTCIVIWAHVVRKVASLLSVVMLVDVVGVMSVVDVGVDRSSGGGEVMLWLAREYVRQSCSPAVARRRYAGHEDVALQHMTSWSCLCLPKRKWHHFARSFPQQPA